MDRNSKEHIQKELMYLNKMKKDCLKFKEDPNDFNNSRDFEDVLLLIDLWIMDLEDL